MAKDKKDRISCEVKAVHGVLSDNGVGTKKIYAKISWNDRDAKDEIRIVKTNEDGEEIVGKGVAISDQEIEKLIDAYHGKKKAEEANKPVDFSDIFGKAPEIIARRDDGSVTENGFIVLQEDGELAERAKSHHSKNP